MRQLTYREAIVEAQAQAMRNDERVIILGEDVGLAYAFGTTRGLLEEFGAERVIDTPISENSFVGMAVGAALTGLKPLVEIQISDLLPLCMDQIVNSAAKLTYMTGGQVSVPLVIRTPGGYWKSFGAHHSQCLESLFMHIPGLKIAIPSTPYDAKGLLAEAIRDKNPVLFFEHKRLYDVEGPVPRERYTIPFGAAEVRKEGRDVTVISFSYMMHRVLEAAEELRGEIDVEVVDLRTLLPLDQDRVLSSAKKTGRVVLVEEGCKTGGVGAELSALVAEEAIEYLDAPILRVGMPHVPHPFSPPLEEELMPGKEKIMETIRRIVQY